MAERADIRRQLIALLVGQIETRSLVIALGHRHGLRLAWIAETQLVRAGGPHEASQRCRLGFPAEAADVSVDQSQRATDRVIVGVGVGERPLEALSPLVS